MLELLELELLFEFGVDWSLVLPEELVPPGVVAAPELDELVPDCPEVLLLLRLPLTPVLLELLGVVLMEPELLLPVVPD
ncbi:MAG TPA: hypothetical protein VKY92_11965 [Verrucomicrobiae bacterium]|nr:hypothetical protein [Verrucomicrobiae bacterium]